jgi:microcompartment protein CcmL/EutN
MAETKTHPVYGEVTVLQSSSALVQVETGDGDSFWVTAASFIDKKKKATKRRAKKKKVIHKLDEPVDALLVRETRAEESEPEVFDELEDIVQQDAEEETEESCEETTTSGEDIAA